MLPLRLCIHRARHRIHVQPRACLVIYSSIAQSCIPHIDQANIHLSWTRLKLVLFVKTCQINWKSNHCLMVTFGCVFKLLCTKHLL